jgi:hypothetical protein
VGVSTSWNPQSLSRPVMGLLYLYLYITFLSLSTQKGHCAMNFLREIWDRSICESLVSLEAAWKSKFAFDNMKIIYIIAEYKVM